MIHEKKCRVQVAAPKYGNALGLAFGDETLGVWAAGWDP
ncbi:hypothetical protein OOU_Y34scaffold00022g37 [Pyricularia oryzae Y34]|uniref:Uncharacterized protein n=2 Tax=Pyricularia oryzae TaxID=318829 RepID=A0AA97PS95_PYRO3|nr:hypothetical protein OOU_Y34scaffold00022g37 [Pyricularia oryzae Y34]